MNRNRNDHFSYIATPHMPRYSRDMGVHRRLQSFKHGHLIPFYSRLVYPHSNLKIESTDFIRKDTSIKVPLDDIIFDKYFFFVPLRIIDPNFEKILGYKNTYDSNIYNFPTMEIDGTKNYPLTHDSLFQYFGYQSTTKEDDSNGYLIADTLTADATKKTGGWLTDNSSTGVFDKVNVYQLAAYYKIYNDYFRDENVDPEIPISDLLTSTNPKRSTILGAQGLWFLFNNFDVLPVNRLHDIYSSGIVSPTGLQGDVTIPLGTSLVPVGWMPNTSGGGSGSISVPSSWTAGSLSQIRTSGSMGSQDIVADMAAATGPSIQQLYLSMALYSLYDKRGTFGSRLIEQIRGSFGLEVPDGLVDRVEYLGGSTQTLNENPVLNTADDLGEMRGNSATLTNVASFDKGFNEWGFVIGVYCTRVKHTYSQGVSNPAWHIFDNLDLYWPEFANVGKFSTLKKRIANNPKATTINDAAFNYVDAYIDQETEIDICAGDFGSWRHSNVTELQQLWSYQDIYGSAPYFSYQWLKEPTSNVRRTLSGLLIPNSAADFEVSDDNDFIVGGHQFMCDTRYHVTLVMAKPPHSKVPNITGRI